MRDRALSIYTALLVSLLLIVSSSFAQLDSSMLPIPDESPSLAPTPAATPEIAIQDLTEERLRIIGMHFKGPEAPGEAYDKHFNELGIKGNARALEQQTEPKECDEADPEAVCDPEAEQSKLKAGEQRVPLAAMFPGNTKVMKDVSKSSDIKKYLLDMLDDDNEFMNNLASLNMSEPALASAMAGSLTVMGQQHQIALMTNMQIVQVASLIPGGQVFLQNYLACLEKEKDRGLYAAQKLCQGDNGKASPKAADTDTDGGVHFVRLNGPDGPEPAPKATEIDIVQETFEDLNYAGDEDSKKYFTAVGKLIAKRYGTVSYKIENGQGIYTVTAIGDVISRYKELKQTYFERLKTAVHQFCQFQNEQAAIATFSSSFMGEFDKNTFEKKKLKTDSTDEKEQWKQLKQLSMTFFPMTPGIMSLFTLRAEHELRASEKNGKLDCDILSSTSYTDADVSKKGELFRMFVEWAPVLAFAELVDEALLIKDALDRISNSAQFTKDNIKREQVLFLVYRALGVSDLYTAQASVISQLQDMIAEESKRIDDAGLRASRSAGWVFN